MSSEAESSTLSGLLVAIDLAHEAGEDLAGADLDEVGGALGDEELDALDPADGTGDLADEAVGDVGAVGDEAGVDVGGDGEVGVVEGRWGRGRAARASCAGCMRAQWKGALTGSMTVRLAPACLQRSAARSTAAVAPEMTVWSGELRLAGETTALLGVKVLASGVPGSGVRSSETWEQMVWMSVARGRGLRPLRLRREARPAACIGRGSGRCGRRRRR